MPVIIIRGSNCSLVGVDDEIVSFLDSKFSYKPVGYEYSNTYISGEWDGRIHLFHKEYFPIGFIHDVRYAIENIFHEKLLIKDFRTVGPDIGVSYPRVPLRSYQFEALNRISAYSNCSAEIATGGGKTLIAAAFIAKINKRALVIVPSSEILYQMQNMLSEYLKIDVGIIGDGKSNIKDVTVGTWQSLSKDDYLDYLKTVDTLIIDECQHIGSNILKQVSKRCPAKYRLGMSGTLFREDGCDLELIAATGPKVFQISYSDLIKLGYLVPAKIDIYRVPGRSFGYYDTYSDVYDDYIINNKTRNKIIANVARDLIRQGRKILIFVSRIEHGHILKELINCDFVYSKHPDRREIIDNYRSGKINCLISTSLLQEGIDIPPIDALILAGPQRSLIATVQKIGRSLRPFTNKKDCIIVDFQDNAKYLIKHFERRYKYYKTEKSMEISSVVDGELYARLN